MKEKDNTYSSFLREADASVGAFLEIHDGAGVPSSSETSSLSLPVAVKDNIAVSGMYLTCGSRMLENLLCPYDATAVARLRASGAAIVGKTNMDEFGMGSSTDTSALKKTSNPWDLSRVAGGSSGGSAAAVAQQLVPVALGSDTGGSIRQPAAFCGVYGLKPTYGTVSRYGLVAYASSLEVIGVLGANIDQVMAAYRAIAGEDPLDQTSRDPGSFGGSIPGSPASSATTIGVLEGELGLSPEVARNYKNTRRALEDLGYRTVPVRLSTLEYVVPAYYTIATAEASTNLARYNGVRYGYRPDWAENPEELMRKARSEAFGQEVKLRIVLGTYVLRSGFQDQYYTRAQKIRTLIRRELDSVYRDVAMILMPAFPVQAFPHADAHGDAAGAPSAGATLDAFQQKVADRFTCTANLAAVPALTVPTGLENGLPVGMQLMGPPLSEESLAAVAGDLATVMPIQFPRGSQRYDEWLATRGASDGSGSASGTSDSANGATTSARKKGGA